MIMSPCFGPVAQCACTLGPLVRLGRDALVPDLALGIEQVVLQEIGVRWENVFQEIVVRRASDVFACAAAAGAWYDPLPPGARLVWGVLRFHLADSAQACQAEIWPPRTLILTPASAAERVERWLIAHGFAVNK